MKSIKFYLTNTLHHKANKIIREKSDILGLLLHTIPEIFIATQKDMGLGHCEIIVDKMSRIIFTIKNKERIYKKFSFNFPFTLKKVEPNEESFTEWEVSDYEGEIINSQVISILLILFEENAYKERLHTSIEPLEFYDQILQTLKEVEAEPSITDRYIWQLIRQLYLFEPGYIRYDFDDTEGRCNEITHPLHHLDIHFSSNVTLKIGIAKNEADFSKWKEDSFESLLNVGNPCYYLKL